MRISTNNVMQTSLSDMSTALERYTRAQNLVSSGKQLTKPSDDPAGTSYSLSLQNALDSIDQYRSNISDAKGFLSTAESALSSATDLVRSVRTTVVQASSTQMTDQSRLTLADSVDSAIKQLAQIANSTYGTRYVFAGQRTADQPFVQNGDTYDYKGGSKTSSDGTLTVDIGSGQSMTINTPGDELFSSAFALLSKIKTDITEGQTVELSDNDLSQLDTIKSTIMNARSAYGTKVSSLEQTDSRLEQNSLQLTETKSKIVDADVPTAVIQLQTAQMAYQAALSATSKTLSMNLLDFLK